MSGIVNFDNWTEYENAPYGSGASKKSWLIDNFTGNIGLFKFPKIHTYKINELTGEHWAEKIASDIAKVIKVPCATVELGTYLGELGAMSHIIIDDSKEILNEGIQYITNKYPTFNTDKLYDEATGKRYSIQMILECIQSTGIANEFFMIPIFDCLIGNSDRHHSNWGIIVNQYGNPLRISPLYDNSSSLCCREPEEAIVDILRDTNRFNAIVSTKSKSSIRWGEDRTTRHFDMLINLKHSFYNETVDLINDISNYLTDDVIDNIIFGIDSSIMSNLRKDLVNKFVKYRRDRMIQIYES